MKRVWESSLHQGILYFVVLILAMAMVQIAEAGCTIEAGVTDTENVYAYSYCNFGQSFTACVSGTLSKIFLLIEDNWTNRELTIYEGDGLSGTNLGTVTGLTLSQSDPYNTDWKEIDVSSLSISVTNGSSYTFYFANTLCSAYGTYDGSIYSGGQMYYDGSGYSGYDIYFKVEIGDGSLPVDLSSFSAVCEGQSVILEWVTESETDNLGFILERKTGDSEWEQIASYQTNDALKGQGNTSSKTEYAFTDTNVEPGTTYEYRLSDVSTDGEMTTYSPLSITLNALPEETAMEKAYPNPFNPSTFISYHLVEDGQVEISVYDMLGRKVQTLFNGQQLAGSYQVYWNGNNEAGNISPTGTYLIRMQTEKTTQVQKVLLMK